MNHVILRQGKPVRRYVSIVKQAQNIVAINIEMKSKWCRVAYVGEAYGCPLVGIEPSEGAMYLCHAESEITEILFHEYKGLEVFSASGGRYSIRVCLTTESPVCGSDDGVSSRVARLKALGNAVVPQIPEIIGRAIMCAERID